MSDHANPVRVLLVDDDDIFRNFVREALEELGKIEVQEANDGNKARHLLRTSAEKPDLIVCDVFMPDMDGMEFLDFLVGHGYRGKLTMVSGGDASILDVARTFAVQSGLQLIGAFPKASVTPALLGAILNFANPRLEQQT
jgi:CheY-like chemotaxis protein